MITLIKFSRKVRMTGYDLVTEEDIFTSSMHNFPPKLIGKWKIAWLTPTAQDVRAVLVARKIPDYMDVDILLDGDILSNIANEFSSLRCEEDSPWSRYMKLLEGFSPRMDKRVMREIYYRAGPEIEGLEKALDVLKDYETLTLKILDMHLPPVVRIFPKTILLLFLSGDCQKGWKQLSIMEKDISLDVCFYSMRKTIKKLLSAKADYLQNKETAERSVDKIDSFTVLHAYYLFLDAKNPTQLLPILNEIERRHYANNVGRMAYPQYGKHDNSARR